jgi:membrane-associated phospholipid phosphatase
MNRLKAELKRGIFGTGWVNVLVCVALAAALYFMNMLYSILNHGPNVLFLKSALDDIIPLVPQFAIPYISLDMYVYASLIVFLVFRTSVFKAASLSMFAAWGVSYLFYIFLQSYMDRPVLEGNDYFIGLIRQVYEHDNPYNCFPSLHTSISTIVAIHWWRGHRGFGIAAAVWSCLIVLSTMFVKQHYIADVASGLVLAFGVSFLFAKLFPDRKPEMSPGA